MEAVGGKWESQSKGEIFSVGKQTCFLQKGIDIETKGTQLILWRKTLWLHFSGLGDFS